MMAFSAIPETKRGRNKHDPMKLNMKWVRAALFAATPVPIATNKAVTVVPILSPQSMGTA